MKSCPYCDSVVADDSPVFVAVTLERELRDQWYLADRDGNFYSWGIGKILHVGDLGDVEVVDKKIRALPEEFTEGYYDGGTTLPQGTTFEAYVVLKVGDNFYKKTGEGDSYSDITWSGPVVPVKPKAVTKVVYSFE